MRYCTELDLIQIPKAQKLFFNILKLPGDQKNLQTLLSMRNGIKKVERIVDIITSLEFRSWPYSYSRIRKVMDNIYKKLS